MTTLTLIAAWFAFGYSVTDIVMNYRSNRKIEQFVKELEDRHHD